MKTYIHKYHVIYPLNIYVGCLRNKINSIIRNKINSIKEILHFWSFVTGFHSLLEKFDEENKKDSID